LKKRNFVACLVDDKKVFSDSAEDDWQIFPIAHSRHNLMSWQFGMRKNASHLCGGGIGTLQIEMCRQFDSIQKESGSKVMITETILMGLKNTSGLTDILDRCL
jgi:hypothetical protein